MTRSQISDASLPRTARRGAGLRIALVTVALAIGGGVLQAAQAAPHGGMDGGHGMGMMMGGGFGERMLDSVNATADQRAQVKTIMTAAHADLKALREQGRPLHQQMQALFTQPTVDANAAEALRQRVSALRDQGSKRLLQAMIDVSRVLTPDQRAKLAERMNARRAMMERHMMERQKLDAPNK